MFLPPFLQNAVRSGTYWPMSRTALERELDWFNKYLPLLVAMVYTDPPKISGGYHER